MNLYDIFGDNAKKIRQIEKNNIILISLYDVYNIIGGINSPQTFLRLKYTYHEYKNIEVHKFKGQGQRDTPVIPLNLLSKSIKIYLSTSNICMSNKNKWLELIGEKDYIPMPIQTESEIMNIIQKSFRNYETKKHYYVDI